MVRIPQNAITLAAYLGGVATILVLQAIQPETQVVVMPGTANILARPPVTADLQKEPTPQPSQPAQPTKPQPQPKPEVTTVPTCRDDDDCGSSTAVCAVPYGVCEEMRSPTCSCSQPQVLLCNDGANRSKHTFCPGGCEGTGNEARCV
jgi:hypothetical protein